MTSAAKDTTRIMRWMVRRDMAEILQIESDSFDYPWSEDDFIRVLRDRCCIGMVVEDRRGIESFSEKNGPIDGYMLYELQKGCLCVLNFAVRFDVRRQGVGSMMAAKLIGKLRPHYRERIALEISESNYYAQAFFRSQGFRAVNVLRGYYKDTDDDAYRFVYRLPGVIDHRPADAGCRGK